MCADIDYEAQSHCFRRLHQIFGNDGSLHLDLACGTGPHIRYFLDYGYNSAGLDINQPMLDKAIARCPDAQFSLQNMCAFQVDEPQDLITCFLYSIHYNEGIAQLQDCIARVHKALSVGGVFCFDAVAKNKITNKLFVTHRAEQDSSLLTFNSGWYYCGNGERQLLKLSIKEESLGGSQFWQDEHPMVALTFEELQALLKPYFSVHIFEHDHDKLIPWDEVSGTAIFACVKI
jgi:SAM-dependent methyltransferase